MLAALIFIALWWARILCAKEKRNLNEKEESPKQKAYFVSV